MWASGDACLPFFHSKHFIQKENLEAEYGHPSDFYDQEMGVLQSSILSVTLFIVKINSITRCFRNGADKSLFLDDFGVSYRSKYMQAIERQLQLHLHRIEENPARGAPYGLE